MPKACVPGTLQKILFFSISSLAIVLCLTGCGAQLAGTSPSTPPGSSGAGSGSVQSVDHVVLMLQENRSFDSYFGMLNPYRKTNKLMGSPGTELEFAL